MELKAPPEKIRAFWEERADTFKTSGTATLPERAMHALEIKAIAQKLEHGLDIADVGCGNGYATLRFARRFASNFYGFDYSERMVHYARQALSEIPSDQLVGSVAFEVGDALHLACESNRFDRVITERCIQNLPSWHLQADAIAELLRILRVGGLLLMAECSQTGVEQLNQWRRKVRRPLLNDIVPWHNFFLDDNLMLRLQNTEFPIKRITINHYSSTYTFVTRILPFWRLLYYRGRLATLLPNVGRFGYFKLYVLEKSVNRA
jgi:ubiquinone/menaquinone biosynthesis C-methylase UbiE